MTYSKQCCTRAFISKGCGCTKTIVAAVFIRAEVTAQESDVILYSGKSEHLCKSNQPKKMSQALNYVMLL